MIPVNEYDPAPAGDGPVYAPCHSQESSQDQSHAAAGVPTEKSVLVAPLMLLPRHTQAAGSSSLLGENLAGTGAHAGPAIAWKHFGQPHLQQHFHLPLARARYRRTSSLTAVPARTAALVSNVSIVPRLPTREKNIYMATPLLTFRSLSTSIVCCSS